MWPQNIKCSYKSSETSSAPLWHTSMRSRKRTFKINRIDVHFILRFRPSKWHNQSLQNCYSSTVFLFTNICTQESQWTAPQLSNLQILTDKVWKVNQHLNSLKHAVLLVEDIKVNKWSLLLFSSFNSILELVFNVIIT